MLDDFGNRAICISKNFICREVFFLDEYLKYLEKNGQEYNDLIDLLRKAASEKVGTLLYDISDIPGTQEVNTGVYFLDRELEIGEDISPEINAIISKKN